MPADHSDHGGDAHPTADAPLALDWYCVSCGYNLRGLAGDPVRCPECGYSNPIEAGELPDDLIQAELRRGESTAAFSLGMLLWLSAMVLVAIAKPILIPCLAFACLPAIVLWPYLVCRFREYCADQPGWRAAFITYHVLGLVHIITTTGLVLAPYWGVVSLVSRHNMLPDPMLSTAGCLGGAVGSVPAYFWSRWLYRKIKAPIARLQLQGAKELARQRLRRKMTRAPRWWRR